MPSTVAILAQVLHSSFFVSRHFSLNAMCINTASASVSESATASESAVASAIFSATKSAIASAKAHVDIKALADAIASVKETTSATCKTKVYALAAAARAEEYAIQATHQVQKHVSYILSAHMDSDTTAITDQVARASIVAKNATELAKNATVEALKATCAYTKACEAAANAKICLEAAVVHAQMTSSAAALLACAANHDLKQAVDQT